MKSYIALLRGINVSGQKIILMADLKKLFESLGFSKVVTYIQSGNVVFKSRNQKISSLEKLIKDEIKKVFLFDVEIIVKELNEFIEIVHKNPFKGKTLKAGEKIYFTLLSQKPTDESINRLMKLANGIDEFKIGDKAVYILCRKGYGKTLYNNNFIEKKLKVNAMSRNLETMKKLIEIGKGL